MQRVGEHPVPTGPLAPRWLAYEIGRPRAGGTTEARVLVENAGSATWHSRGAEGVQLAYHWLDRLGNPILWEGVRSALLRPLAPGETAEVPVSLVAPRPPGAYVLAFDLVEEHRFWFADVGAPTLDLPVDVLPRIAARRLRVVVHGGADPFTTAALAAQEEAVVEDDAAAVAHLVAGAEPAPDWSRRLLDAHEEGWAAVGPAVVSEDRGQRRRLAAWGPGGGRNPAPARPLLLPSLLAGLEPDEHEGLPAWTGADALFDGRIVVRLRRRSGRRPG